MRQERHVGAYGTCLRAGRLLVVRKARGPYTGRFDLPGGGIEFGEGPTETVVREFLEETGLQVAVERLVGAFSHVATFRPDRGREEVELHHLGFLYRVRELSLGEHLREEPDGLDSLGALWLPVAEATPERVSPLVARALLVLGA